MSGRLFVASFLATIVASPALSQDPSFRTGVQLVEVDAAVADASGRPVTGLQPQDFEIREDGHPVRIVSFVRVAGAGPGRPAADSATARTDGRFLVLVLDNLTTSPMLTTRIKDIARQFVARMNGDDELGIIQLDGDQARTTTSRQRAMALVDAFPRERPAAPLGWWTADNAMDNVADMGRRLAVVAHRRKALVFIGSPAVFVPTIPGVPRTYSPSWFGALHELALANVAVYFVDPQGGERTGMSPAYDGAIGFADESGGAAFVGSNLFDRVVDRIWRETGNYYLLGYEPPSADGKAHAIAVRVKRHHVRVRARRSR